jgi:SpoVK/Ycf46/Vps4 family AAA+-type ATPase
MYGINPLGLSADTHKKLPQVKGMLLYGPAGSGKTLLARAIATQTGALFLNLSASNLEGKVEGKELGKVVARAFRVAKIHAPAVIFIDDADTLCSAAKKGKKTGGSGLGGKMVKDLQAKIKELVPGDRVLVIGETRTPGTIDAKAATSLFDRFIYCPRPDYGTRLHLWRTFIQQRGGPYFSDNQLQSLAQISDGYTAGTLHRVVAEIITDQRKKRTAQKPIAPDEFASALAKFDPIWMHQHQEFAVLNDALPQPACRRKLPPPPTEDDGAGDKKGKKGDKKKKK